MSKTESVSHSANNDDSSDDTVKVGTVRYIPETKEGENRTWENIVYNQLPLMDQSASTERYHIQCDECDYETKVTGGEWKVVGKIMEHSINDLEPMENHHVTITDISDLRSWTNQ